MPQLRALAKAAIDIKTVATATFDGSPIEVFRTKSPVFHYHQDPVDGLYKYFGLSGPQFDGNIRAVSDGYWAVVQAPSAGAHTVHIHGANSAGFDVDVTYHLTVQ